MNKNLYCKNCGTQIKIKHHCSHYPCEDCMGTGYLVDPCSCMCDVWPQNPPTRFNCFAGCNWIYPERMEIDYFGGTFLPGPYLCEIEYTTILLILYYAEIINMARRRMMYHADWEITTIYSDSLNDYITELNREMKNPKGEINVIA